MKNVIHGIIVASFFLFLACSKAPPSENSKNKCINNDCTKAINDCPEKQTCGGESCQLHKDCYKGFVCSKEKKCEVDESLSGSNSENPPHNDGSSNNDGGTSLDGQDGSDNNSGNDSASDDSTTSSEKCNNNIDKDGDGLAGIMDPDCQSNTCIGEPKACAECGVCSKAFEPCYGELYISCEMNLVKGYEKDKETKCEDKEDNDCDCLADLEDPDCLNCKEGDISADPCPSAGVGVCNIQRKCVNNSFDDPKSCEFPKEFTGDASEKFGGKNHFGQDICSDSLDNDCDGKTDCEESECGESSSCGCTYIPPVGVFDPIVKFHWPYDQILAGETIKVPNSTNVLTTPTVANLTDDNGDNLIDDSDIPDIVFVTYVNASLMGIDGTLRAISGDDGHEIFTVTGYDVYPSTTVAIGDINNDGFVELVLDQGADYNTVGIYVFSHTGQYLWEASNAGTYIGGAGISDIDHDGTPEILLSDAMYDAVGNLKCTLEGNIYDWSAPFALDLTGLPNDSIINRLGIWKYEAGQSTCAKLWTFQPVGWKAVANLDADKEPEIVSVGGGGNIRIYEHDGTLKKEFSIPIDPEREDPDPNKAIGARGGPPTLSDFDGDGQVEIAVASSFYYFVFETDGTINWAHKTQDFTSGITGSSLFDFDGDGIAEVVYGDEKKMRIYSGPGGSGDSDNDGYKDANILYEYSIPSATRVEYPVIVDVDGDGKAEIVVAANVWGGSGTAGEEGIYVFEDKLDNWMPTRKIWNQHAYYVTNVNENGSIPKNPQKNWEIPGLNNFRQNTKILTQIDYAAPDLITPFVDEKSHNCNVSVTLTARISNIGQLEVRPGVQVSFYKKSIADGTITEIGTAKTKKVIKPQSYEIVEFTYTFISGETSKDFLFSAMADSDNKVNECREDNNESPVINLPVCQ